MIITKFILSWRMCLGLIFLALALSTLQLKIANAIEAKATVTERTCTVANYVNESGVSLVLDCKGDIVREADPKVVVSHIKNPGPLVCRIAINARKVTILQSCKPRDDV